MHKTLRWSAVLLLVWAQGCRCAGGGVGERCRTNADCEPGLYCSAETGSCTEPPGGTDAVTPPGTDAITPPGTDATVPGTDAVATDANVVGSDASGPGTDAATPGTDAAMAGCGDGACAPGLGEDCLSCAVDCGACCPNGTCDTALGETCGSCPGDCGGCCPNGTCDTGLGETCASCAADCGACCGDAFCDGSMGETCATCAGDCGPCPPSCGDGSCNGVETDCTCPADCGPVCGDGCCTGGETDCSCAADCGAVCGDGCCTGGENDCGCPGDCGAMCGDGCCTGGENDCTCAADCAPMCGDGCCTGGETCASCAGDCGTCGFCGDGSVDAGEECDLGAGNATNAACLPGCIAATCGDGFVSTVGPGYFEECDPPGTGCTAACLIDPDACPMGIGSVACGSVATASNTAAGSTDTITSYSCNGFSYTGNEVAYTFIPSVSTTVTFALTGLSGDLDLLVLTGAPACGTSTCVEDSTNGGSMSEAVTMAVTAGQPYYVVIDGYAGAASSFTLTVTCGTGGSGTCADPYTIVATGPSTTTRNVNTCGDGNDSTSPALGDCTAGGGDGPDVVYRLDLGYAASVSLDLWDNDGSVPIDTVLYVRSACTSTTAGSQLACSDDIMGEVRHAHLDLALAAGTYYVIVDGWEYTSGGGTTFSCGNVELVVDTF